jgi:hypothetical protein
MGRFVTSKPEEYANSGLIVAPKFRKGGWQKPSNTKYSNSVALNILMRKFGLTTGLLL